MIHEVAGDILLSEAAAIAHGVAPNDNFANGPALALRKRWPGMYKDFPHYCRISAPKSGELWSWADIGNVRIVTLFTQEALPSHGSKPGKASVENVNHCLNALRKTIESEKFSGATLPKLATGMGGLDWKDVKPWIEKHLGNPAIPVYVFFPSQPGVKVKEQ